MPQKRRYRRDGTTVTHTYTLSVITARAVSVFAKENDLSVGAVLDLAVQHANWDDIAETLNDKKRGVDAEV